MVLPDGTVKGHAQWVALSQPLAKAGITPPALNCDGRFRQIFNKTHSRPSSEFFIQAAIGWMLDQFNVLSQN